METWFIVLLSIAICALLRWFFTIIMPSKNSTLSLPPGPPPFPMIGNLFMLRNTFSQVEHILTDLHAKYGPIITVYIGSIPQIFISSHSLAHQALVQNGAVFSNRPTPTLSISILSYNQHDINTAFYGLTWRILRRNITSEVFNSSRIKSFSGSRKLVLDILGDNLKSQSGSCRPVRVKEIFRYSMFFLLSLICFGDNLGKRDVQEIEDVHYRVLLGFTRFNALNVFPRIGRFLFRKRWEELIQLYKDREDVLMPFISDRRKLKEKNMSDRNENNREQHVLAYVDTLLDLELPHEQRKLKDTEIVSVCSEFLLAGTDTTSTALQWIMAILVKHQHIQERLYNEIKKVVGETKDHVNEDHLQKIKYLKAVIFEGLRRHPPVHFALPHAVTEDTELAGYSIPKNAVLNFMIAKMGCDPDVWEDPMAFNPERFMNGDKLEAPDINGSNAIKMMPFGVGRRVCPGMGLATLHLEYYVANLVWKFMWKPVDQFEVDLSEKVEFTVGMKNPLHAYVFPRSTS